MILITFILLTSKELLLNSVFLLTKERKWYCVTLSFPSVFMRFQCYTHIFASLSFCFSKKIFKSIYYYYDFTEVVSVIFFIRHCNLCFRKNIFVTLSSHCSKVWHLNMILMALLPPNLVKLFSKMNYRFFRINLNQKVMILCF